MYAIGTVFIVILAFVGVRMFDGGQVTAEPAVTAGNQEMPPESVISPSSPSKKETVAPSNESDSAKQVLQKAEKLSSDVSTMNFDSTVTMSGKTSAKMIVRGDVSTNSNDAVLRGSISTQVPNFSMSGNFKILIKGNYVYTQVGPMIGGTRWDTTSAKGSGGSMLTYGRALLPQTILKDVAIDSSITKIGSETVNNTQTTHYQVTDPKTRVTIGVWIGEDGYPVRINFKCQSSCSIAPKGLPTGTALAGIEINYNSFNKNFTVPTPAGAGAIKNA